jgi:hypothetical protein
VNLFVNNVQIYARHVSIVQINVVHLSMNFKQHNLIKIIKLITVKMGFIINKLIKIHYAILAINKFVQYVIL